MGLCFDHLIIAWLRETTHQVFLNPSGKNISVKLKKNYCQERRSRIVGRGIFKCFLYWIWRDVCITPLPVFFIHFCWNPFLLNVEFNYKSFVTKAIQYICEFFCSLSINRQLLSNNNGNEMMAKTIDKTNIDALVDDIVASTLS